MPIQKKQKTEIFPNDQFTVNILERSNTVEIRSIIDPTDNICLQLIIYNDYIIVSSLRKCDIREGQGTGASLMSKVELLAKKNGISCIRIFDDSKIFVCSQEIDLFYFKIITKGISWYNSLGYKSEIYDDEIKQNNPIISSPISEVAKTLKIDISMFPSISENETVQQYVTRLFNSIQQQEPHCDQIHKDKGIYLNLIIKTISKSLLYDRMLTKIIIKSAGRRKQRTKNKKTNKKKRTLKK